MLTDERKEHCRFNDEVLMDDKHLGLLAQASQPTQCAQCLIDSPILRVLGQAIAEFCHKQLQSRGNQETPAQQNQSRQGMCAPKRNYFPMPKSASCYISTVTATKSRFFIFCAKKCIYSNI